MAQRVLRILVGVSSLFFLALGLSFLLAPGGQTDAFLNRPMRAELALSPPERRIGQTAHDFVAALGAPQAILSRARKRGGAPTVSPRHRHSMAAPLASPISITASSRSSGWHDR